MNFLRKLFGKKGEDGGPASTPAEREYVICPNCGAGYNTQMVATSIFMKSPFMADMASWTTRIVCSICRTEFLVSGSYGRVFGQPKPK